MRNDLRICGLLDSHEIVERNHLPGVGAQIILTDVFWLRAEFAVGLHVNTVRAVIKIEIVHINRPHVNLQSVTDLAEGHLQALGLFAVDAHQVLRVVRREAGEKSNDILADIPLRRQLVRRLRDALQRVASQILQLKLESPELPQSLHRRWIERNHDRAGYRGDGTAQTCNRCRGRVRSSLAIFKWPKTVVEDGLIRARTRGTKPPNSERAFDLRIARYLRQEGARNA